MNSKDVVLQLQNEVISKIKNYYIDEYRRKR